MKLNASALEYKPPTILDLAPIAMPIVESRLGGGCYGAVGVSHSTNSYTLISTAVFNAIGKWITPPITPDKVLAALGKIPSDSVREVGSS